MLVIALIRWSATTLGMMVACTTKIGKFLSTFSFRRVELVLRILSIVILPFLQDGLGSSYQSTMHRGRNLVSYYGEILRLVLHSAHFYFPGLFQSSLEVYWSVDQVWLIFIFVVSLMMVLLHFFWHDSLINYGVLLSTTCPRFNILHCSQK